MEKDIGKIAKNEQTEIVIGIREFSGRVGVDIREFTSTERYTGPTKKGLRIPAEKFLEFRELINSINIEDLKSAEAGAEGGQKELGAEEEKKEEASSEEGNEDY